jgi:hypothetical protein
MLDMLLLPPTFFPELPKIENPVDAVWITHNAKVSMILLVFRHESEIQILAQRGYLPTSSF